MREIDATQLRSIRSNIDEQIKNEFTENQIQIIIYNMVETRIKKLLLDNAHSILNNQLKDVLLDSIKTKLTLHKEELINSIIENLCLDNYELDFSE